MIPAYRKPKIWLLRGKLGLENIAIMRFQKFKMSLVMKSVPQLFVEIEKELVLGYPKVARAGESKTNHVDF